MKNRTLAALALCGILLPVCASAQDVVVMRRSVSPPRGKVSTPVAPSTPKCSMQAGGSYVDGSRSPTLAIKAVGATTEIRLDAGRAWCESMTGILACEVNTGNGYVAAWTNATGTYVVKTGTAITTYGGTCSK